MLASGPGNVSVALTPFPIELAQHEVNALGEPRVAPEGFREGLLRNRNILRQVRETT
jgi:hypothetical protein